MNRKEEVRKREWREASRQRGEPVQSLQAGEREYGRLETLKSGQLVWRRVQRAEGNETETRPGRWTRARRPQRPLGGF